jgi:hypothetical protein
MADDQTADQTPAKATKLRPRNALLVAVAIEVQCPYCGATQPAPGGSEFCEISEAKEMCGGQIQSCVSCDGPIRVMWHDKVQVL